MKKKHLLIIFPLIFGCQIKNTELKFNDDSANKLSRTPSSEFIDYDSRLILSDRNYVQSVFTQIFNVSAGSADETKLKELIFNQYVFGGGCELYGGSEIRTSTNTFVHEYTNIKCAMNFNDGITENLQPHSNSMRYAMTMKACDYSVNNSVMMNSAMRKVFPAWNPPGSLPLPDTLSISRTYRLFYLNQSPSPELISDLFELASLTNSSLEKWKLIMNTICISPSWQVF